MSLDLSQLSNDDLIALEGIAMRTGRSLAEYRAARNALVGTGQPNLYAESAAADLLDLDERVASALTAMMRPERVA